MRLIELLEIRREKRGTTRYARFFCDFCKTEVIRRLHNGKKQPSCGCNQHLKGSDSHYFKHGKTHTKLFRVWVGMISRCNPTTTHKDNRRWYGDRGIKVCDEWANSFEAFNQWSEVNGYQPGLHLDRINNDGNYEPGNCQYITCKENVRKQERFTKKWALIPKIQEALDAGWSKVKIYEVYGITSTSVIKYIRNGQLTHDDTSKTPEPKTRHL